MTYWLLKLLPNSFFYMSLMFGTLGVLSSFVLNFIPFVSQYRMIIQVISIVLLVIGVYFAGAISNNDNWEQQVAELKNKILVSEKASAELNGLLIEQLLLNEKKMVEINNINKKYLDSIRTKVDKDCKINSDVINLHNSAAKNVGIK